MRLWYASLTSLTSIRRSAAAAAGNAAPITKPK